MGKSSFGIITLRLNIEVQMFKTEVFLVYFLVFYNIIDVIL